MAFVCKSCGVAQEAGTKPNNVVVEVRNVHYSPLKDDNGNVRIPVGTEIAKQIDVCPQCFATKDFNCSVIENKVLE